jgi:hypothetical protein
MRRISIRTLMAFIDLLWAFLGDWSAIYLASGRNDGEREAVGGAGRGLPCTLAGFFVRVDEAQENAEKGFVR